MAALSTAYVVSVTFCLGRPRDALCGSTYDNYEDCLRLAAVRRTKGGSDLSFNTSEALLSQAEIRSQYNFLQRYENRERHRLRQCCWEDFIAHTGDCPTGERSGWCTWTVASHKLPALRKHSGLYWAFAAGRHIGIREMYTAMGFPAFDFLFQRPWMPHPLPYDCFPADFTWLDAKRALGNAQHVGCVGAFMGILLLSSAKLDRPTPFFAY